MRHTFDSARKSLSKKGVLFPDNSSRGLTLNFIEGTKDKKLKIIKKKTKLSGFLIVLNNAHDLGNGSWGKIDYLCKKHNYNIYGLSTYQQITSMP